MPALLDMRAALRGLAGNAAQGVATASTALRKALARLVSNGGGTHDGTERRTR